MSFKNSKMTVYFCSYKLTTTVSMFLFVNSDKKNNLVKKMSVGLGICDVRGEIVDSALNTGAL